MLETINLLFVLIFTYYCICWAIGGLLYEHLFSYALRQKKYWNLVATFLALPLIFPIKIVYELIKKALY